MHWLTLATVLIHVKPGHGQIGLPDTFAAGLQVLQSQVAGLNLGFFGQSTSAVLNQRIAAATKAVGNIGVISIPPIELILSSTTGPNLASITLAQVLPLSASDPLPSATSQSSRTTLTIRATATESSRTAQATSLMSDTISPVAALPAATSSSTPPVSSSASPPRNTTADGGDAAGLAAQSTSTKSAAKPPPTLIIVGSVGAFLALASIVGVFFFIKRRRQARFDEKMFCRGDSIEKTLSVADKTYGGLSRKVSKSGKVLKIQRLWQRQPTEQRATVESSFNLLSWRHVAGTRASLDADQAYMSKAPELPEVVRATQSEAEEDRDEVADILHKYTDPTQSRGFSSLYSTDGELPIVLGSPVRATSPWFKWQVPAPKEDDSVLYGQQRTGVGNVVLGNDVLGGRIKSVRPVPEQSKFSFSDYSNDYRQTRTSMYPRDASNNMAPRQSKHKPRTTMTNFSVRSGGFGQQQQQPFAGDSTVHATAQGQSFLQRYLKKAWGRN
ncbi:hypothetical protein BCR37DRAFT_244253 [Protomyces lactucae-debilis]|uniref:Mid2 domain-containing protein n=1 Tax=Protomyces lactucae-debilis TaxID=2754530 RepID=A0A1Y2FSF9_PROLT|nr:uncharacterized protein BCR37DRAFT_244253 [Protomyces lactucae-debilis]ORY85645.1 hypothetical protein BCR37DRAFT_244253 [Protomyces lactucae-debilis]